MVEIHNAYILAGGRSRRMGRDKLLVRCDGELLVTRAIRLCKSEFSAVKLVAPTGDKFASLGCDVVADSALAEGPLAGIIAALEDCPDEYCFVTAADLYDLNARIIDDLVAAYRGEQYLGLDESGKIQPLCGIYHKSSLPHLKAQATDGQWSVRHAVVGLQYRLLPLPVERWRNINSPDDLTGIEVPRD